MPVPSYRVPVRVARGTLAALTAGLADLQEGELCYATDENVLYVIEGGVLTATVADLTGIEIVNDTTPQLGGNLDTNSFQIISTAAGNIQVAPDTTGVLEVMGNTGNDAAIQLNCEANTHGIKLKSPPHSAAASYTLVFPNDTGTSGQALTTDGSGVMSWTTPSTVGSIDDLTDVDTTTAAPTNDQVLAWDGTNWVPADQSGGGGGGGIYTSSTPLSGMAGIDGFYADQAALEADGFTFIASSINSDDEALTIPVPAQYQAVDYLGLGLSGLPACKINTNGAIYFDSQTLTGRSGNIVSDASTAELYVSWWSTDTATRLAGFKEVTTEGTTWLVIRADIKVPYNSSTAGFPVETWLGLDGRIRQYWGTSINGASFSVNASSIGGVVSNSARVTTATDLTSSGAYGVQYFPQAPTDLGFNLIDDLGDVDTTTAAPTNGQVLAWNGTNWAPVDQSGGVTSIIAGAGISVDQATGDVTVTATGGGSGGGSSAARLTEAQTAASGVATFTGIGHSGTLVEVTSSLDAWIVLYDSAASRTADNGRAYNTDPASGSGVLAEFYITAGTTVLATPGTTYFNNDTSVTEAVYAAVRDQAGADVNSQVTIVAYGNQTITSVSGGTFGSGV